MLSNLHYITITYLQDGTAQSDVKYLRETLAHFFFVNYKCQWRTNSSPKIISIVVFEPHTKRARKGFNKI